MAGSRRCQSARATVVAVVASTLFLGFSGGVIFPILPNLSAIVDVSPVLVGVVLSASRFVRLVASAPAGALADRVGTRTPFVAGVALEAAATFGYVVGMGSPVPEAWFTAARALWGLGGALVLATAYTIAADVSESDSRGRTMSLIRGGSSIGFPAGMALGGVASELYGPTVAFEFAASLAAIAAVVAAVAIPETHVEGGKSAVGFRDLDLGVGSLTVGFVNFGLLFAYSGIVFATLVTYLGATDVGVAGFGPEGASGVFIGLSVLVASACTVAGGTLSDRRGGRVPVLLVSLGTMAVGFVLLAAANSLAEVVAAIVLLGGGQGGVNGPLLALLADLTPAERMGRATGTMNALGDLGGALGHLVALPVAERIGYLTLYRAAAVVPIVAAFVLLGGVYRVTGSVLPAAERTA
ncbi:MFS transporter [Halegenticoccus tardaugens]|uniref:MFS transporter n=1 Tax=Halegenticoccus tardaugens TaxID=2071624 RepID=UPI00100A56C2|nr:MFS transporter [Halegenticoccus tardaugens]